MAIPSAAVFWVDKACIKQRVCLRGARAWETSHLGHGCPSQPTADDGCQAYNTRRIQWPAIQHGGGTALHNQEEARRHKPGIMTIVAVAG